MNTTYPRLFRGACAPSTHTPEPPTRPQDGLLVKIKFQVAALRQQFDPDKLVELYRLIEQID
jgi:hypothetical protein